MGEDSEDIGEEDSEVPKMDVKILKYVEDPCFGEQYEQCDQCTNCWIKPSCYSCFKNKKD